MLELGWGEKMVEVVAISGYTEEELMALNIALNKISGDWDAAKLQNWFHRLNNKGFDLKITGFELKDIVIGGFDLDQQELFRKPRDFEDIKTELPKGKAVRDFQLTEFESDDEYQIPSLRSDMLAEMSPDVTTWAGLDAMPFEKEKDYFWLYKTNSRGIEDYSRLTVGFYLADIYFLEIWENYQKSISRMLNAGLRQAIVPNVSMISGEPVAVQIYTRFQSMWLARVMQECGIKVIPDLMFSDKGTYKYAFSGIPKGAPQCMIQVQTTENTKQSVMIDIEGINEAYDRIKFKKLWVYGTRNAGEYKEKFFEYLERNKDFDYGFMPAFMTVRKQQVFNKSTYAKFKTKEKESEDLRSRERIKENPKTQEGRGRKEKGREEGQREKEVATA